MNFLLDEQWRDKLLNRFITYTQFYSTSEAGSNQVPSTERQWKIANYIYEELLAMGIAEVSIDDHAYVMASIPSNVEVALPNIGFIAHFDTSPDFSGEGVKAQIWKNYSGESLQLNEAGFMLNTDEFPELKDYKGQTLITTDGKTLLGADDKAGVAEIVTAVEYLLAHPELKHREIKIGFTPDEEVGKGASKFDVKKFDAQWAYTMDGGAIGELEYENFNAASAKIIFHGKSVHPGASKGKMINASLLAMEFLELMPKEEVPSKTDGYEGFYHLHSMEGNVSEACLEFIIRDHDGEKFQQRKKNIENWANDIATRYGTQSIEVEIKDQYYNMKEKIIDKPYIMETAKKAFEKAQVSPIIKPIRGGTDGSQLSFMGLPCPNIFAGGLNFHGPYEFVPLESMAKATEIIVYIATDLD